MALTMAIAGVASVGSAAQSAPPTCQGQPATIVGSVGGADGTEGDDVIVTDGAANVAAKGGDDLICITGSTGPHGYFIDAGPGDDTVIATRNHSNGQTRLGSGFDTYVGGPDRDDVVLEEDDGERDVVKTGGGGDHIWIGPAETPFEDQLNTGPGVDVLMMGALPGTGSVNLGRGRDVVFLSGDSELAWSIDNRAEEITAGDTSMPFAGAEDFSLSGLTWLGLEFRGDGDDEALVLRRPRGQQELNGRVEVDLAGGSDELVLTSDAAGTFRGGAGHDALTIQGGKVESGLDANVNLARATFSVDDGDSVIIPGFEDLVVGSFGRLRVQANDAANTILVKGCRATLFGGDGNDRIRLRAPKSCADPALVAYGERGADVLIGDRGADVLSGGAGRDRATGRAGSDVCSAEVTRGCESRHPQVVQRTHASPRSAAGADAPSCQGKPATIVGTGPGALGGTAGDDVIVTNGANNTTAGGGDDLICITGNSVRPMYVHAGSGDDVVDSRSGSGQAPVSLGPGADTFIGGSGDDYVSLRNDDGEVDAVSTGAGIDRVSVGHRGAPVIDNVDAGPDLDLITLVGLPGPGRVDGGGGDNLLSIRDRTVEAWRIDLRTQEVRTRDAAMRLPGFTSISLFGVWSSADFIGSERDDSFGAYSDDDGVVTARLGKGDDSFLLSGAGVTGVLRGEGGRDTVVAAGRYVWPDPAQGVVVLDLKRGHMTSATGADVGVKSFEDGAAVRLRKATVIGTAARNAIYVQACRGMVRAGGGNDRIELDSSFVSCGEGQGFATLRAQGESGDDVLIGDEGDDVLIGGAGDDSVDGGEGRDSCSAETTTDCESGQ